MIVVSVDDDYIARNYVSKVLSTQHFTVISFAEAIEAQDYIRMNRFDVMLIDYQLFGGPNGLTLAKQARLMYPSSAVILISAFAGLSEAVQAMQIGVDDLIIKKDVTPPELIQRVSDALMRRRRWFPIDDSVYRTEDNFEIDLSMHTVRWYGKVLTLTDTEYSIVVQLTSNPGQVFNFAELYSLIRGEHISPAQARYRLKTQIYNLRAKFTQGGRYPNPIESVFAVGIRWATGSENESREQESDAI